MGNTEVPAARFPRTIGVVGGGTSGYFAALALKRRFPDVSVTVVESSAVPVIGVGEATTTLMPPFLHQELGLDIVDLFRSVRPTFKLGIKFLWGPPDVDHFTYPFGDASPIDCFAYERDLRPQSLLSLFIGDGRGPVVRAPDGSPFPLLRSLKFAYHLDNEPFVAYLARAARHRGIEHVEATLDGVETAPDGQSVAGLRTSDGRELRFDFYVDATGFRSLLMEGALRSPFLSYASSLFCDRAIVAAVPQADGIEPCTTAETMDAGWCWRIPMMDQDHRGYVHASAFIGEDAAAAEMRAKNPGMGDPWVVRFRSGRHRDFWLGNMVAVGNAYGFVEPLESTALHMVIIELAYLVEGLEALRLGRGDPSGPWTASRSVGAHWDYLRWFLAVHYKYNRRLDTPFWRGARADVDVTGAAELLERFRLEGPWLASHGSRFAVADPTFGYSGLMMLLLGQRAAGHEHARASIERDAWEAMLGRHRGVAARALPHREALHVLHANPGMLVDFATSPSSWCCSERELPISLVRSGRAPERLSSRVDPR